MRWLRTQRDLVGLVAIWGMLLQALIVPFSTTAHATALSDADFALLCATGGTGASPVIVPEDQSQSRTDCQCCHMACHAGCSSACGGLLPGFARAILPGDGLLLAPAAASHARAADAAAHAEAQPRAPPLSFS